MENTRGKFSDEVLSLVKCEVKPSGCIYNPPTKDEIEELCAEKGIENKYISTVIKIFNNIEGITGGAAASEPSPSSMSSSSSSSESSSLSTSLSSSDDDTLSPSDYVSKSGYTQTQQINYVDRVICCLLLFGAGVGATATIFGSSEAEKFLVARGIMEPLCKGPIDRLIRETARQLEPTLAGTTCDERLTRAETILKWAGGIVTTSYAQLTWYNWGALRTLLKDRIFEPMEVQKKITEKLKKKTRKEKTRRIQRRKREKKIKRKDKERKTRSKKHRSKKHRSKKSPDSSGPSGSNPSLSKSKSRSRSKSRTRSRRKTTSKS